MMHNLCSQCSVCYNMYIQWHNPCFFSADDVQSIVSGKLALRYSGPDVDAMKSIAQASQKRSLADFQQVYIDKSYLAE